MSCRTARRPAPRLRKGIEAVPNLSAEPAKPYLAHLLDTIREGLADRRDLDVHERFLLASQQGDGGWSGREGASDLYYTGFALRLAAVLGGDRPALWEKVGPYLSRKCHSQEGLVDFCSFLLSIKLVQEHMPASVAWLPTQWHRQALETLERFRSSDGGYARKPFAEYGSAYQSFLVYLCYDTWGAKPPHLERLLEFFRNRRRRDGGYAEVPSSGRSGANPTAAAVAVLTHQQALQAEEREETIAFLWGLRAFEGGFRANERIPFADALSTFTVLTALRDLGYRLRLEQQVEIARYVDGLAAPGGGFRAASWDVAVDVEYTFCGLGALGLMPSMTEAMHLNREERSQSQER
jgi:geranylgeranyl transferase type-2 subunit beta